MSGTGRLRAKRWNKLEDEIIERYFKKRQLLIDALMEDGYPPFTEPASEREQYQRLIAMRNTGDPAFWNNPQAIKDLERLSARYGDPAPHSTGPFGEESNIRSTQSLYERYV
ncbi:MAG: hypothetical protein ACOC9T_02195 [Myxococcota bacterium]